MPAFDMAEGTVKGEPLNTQVTRIERTEARSPRRQPALAAFKRGQEGAAEHRIGNGIETARRQVFGPADEIAGGIIDQAGQGAAIGPDAFDHGGDRVRIADVAGLRHHAAAMGRHQVGGGLFQHAAAPAADIDRGAQQQESLGHHLAKAGAAAGDQDALARQQARPIHQIVQFHVMILSLMRLLSAGLVLVFKAMF